MPAGRCVERLFLWVLLAQMTGGCLLRRGYLECLGKGLKAMVLNLWVVTPFPSLSLHVRHLR